MKNTETTNKKLQLDVLPRTELGKKVKQLRKKGVIPSNVYGSDIKSISISVNVKEFAPVFKAAGETGIVYLQLDGKSRPTLIKEVQRHPLSEDILHIDFREINLKEKIETDVPVQVEGESIAMTQLGGVLLKQSDELLVEALPEKIPTHIIVDLSTITELGQEIKVSDLAVSPDYIIKEDPEKIVVSVVEHKEESTEVENTPTEGPEIIGATPEEGTADTEGSEGASEEKKEQN